MIESLIIIAVLISPMAIGIYIYRRRKTTTKSEVPPPMVAVDALKIRGQRKQSSTDFMSDRSSISLDEFPSMPANDLIREDIFYSAKIFSSTKHGVDSSMLTDLERKMSEVGLTGQRMMGYYEGEWGSPQANMSCMFALWSTPLANRSGALDASKLDEIETILRDFSQLSSMTVRFPNRTAIEEAARLLDKFCSKVDLLVSIHACPALGSERENRTADDVCKIARTANFTRNSSGTLTFYEDNQCLFTLKARNGAQILENNSNWEITGLTFMLDVPHVSNPGEAFDIMEAVAGKFAKLLHLELVDENGKPLTREDFEMIRDHIDNIRAEMDKYGVEAGGLLARTLFN